ncbi:MAG: DUF1566 domain-containing protein [Saccharospirillaceae bacterium]|nr:DUF1566 domain-containing protein [Pseudomonadales bacterium]NRB80651.1 DUF1566 domain-containing protein [Saccharospirillaceae bacterium]
MLNIKNFLKASALVVLMVPSAWAVEDLGAYQQFCKIDYNAKNEKKTHFIDHDNGSITDKRTGLTWQVCALGQNWAGNDCEFNPSEHTWIDAMEIAEQAQLSGSDNWRLPSIKELMSIVEFQCSFPAMNKKVFPDPDIWFHWSSTYNTNFVKTGEQDFDVAVMGIDFNAGKVQWTDPLTSEARVRLVRDADK